MNKTADLTHPRLATNDAADDFIDLSHLFRTLWHQKVLIGLCTIVFLVFGAVFAFSIATPKYRSTSVLLLDTSGQMLVDLGVSLPGLGSDSQAINTEVEVLKSRRLLQRVVAIENLTADAEFNEAIKEPGVLSKVKRSILGAPDVDLSPAKSEERAIDSLLEAMTARNPPNTNILEVTVETESASKSAALADQIADQYILYQMDVKFEATREASNWLSKRVSDLKQQLEDAEVEVAEFTARTEVVSREGVRALDRQLKELRNRINISRDNMNNARQRAVDLGAAKNATAEDKLATADDDRLTRIYNSEGESSRFAQRFATITSRAEQQAARAEQEATALNVSITELENQIASQTSELIQLQQLTRDAEANRLLYEYFLTRLKENSAQEGIQQADGRILSNAVVPAKPSSPNKPLILAMSLMFGLAIGCGAALWREYQNNTFRSSVELELVTNVPVMGQIPLIPCKKRIEALQYLSDKPASAPAEAIRNLRTSALLAKADKPPQVIVTSSSLPNEGKTTMSFALAQNLSGMGKKVLLVEGDIRRLVFSQYIERHENRGLLSVLAKEIPLQTAVTHNELIKVDVLIGQPSNVNAADVLSSDNFSSFIAEARKTYDHIVIDTPPVLVVPDARIIANYADLLLLAVHWDKTLKGQVKDALAMFSSIGRNVDGLILNQVDSKGMKRYGYGDRYGAYGTYGSNYYTN